MQKETKLYGLRAILEAIEADKSIDKIFLQKGLRGELFTELEKKIRKKDLNFSYVPVEKLNRLTTSNHQGAVAQISPISFYDLDALVTAVKETKEHPLFLVLDQLSDVRNFGAIIRTAECTGVDGIIIQKKGSAPINGDTIKTSAGAVFNIPICKVDHIKDAIFFLKEFGIEIIGSDDKASKNLYKHNFKSKTAIILGSEGSGINKSILNICDEKINIPLHGKLSSLNVSVAAGIFLSEFKRQSG